MECNKKCYWNFNGECCPEDEEGYNNANPKEDEECPTFLRKDFEQHFHETHYKIIKLLNKRNCAELEAIEKFILSQREGEK